MIKKALLYFYAASQTLMPQLICCSGDKAVGNPIKLDGTAPPDTPAEQVRKCVRAIRKPGAMDQCHSCGGREVIGILMKNSTPMGGTKAIFVLRAGLGLASCSILKLEKL
ncbi:hypothetical protein ACVWYU_001826 [Pseudomonas sp. TE12234]